MPLFAFIIILSPDSPTISSGQGGRIKKTPIGDVRYPEAGYVAIYSKNNLPIGVFEAKTSSEAITAAEALCNKGNEAFV